MTSSHNGLMSADADEQTTDREDLTRVVGVNVRARRQEVGFSIAELGRRAGVSGPFISQLEAGRSSLSIPTLYRVAQALGIAPNGLLPESATGDPSSQTRTPELVTRAGHGPTMRATVSDHPQEPRLLTRRGPGVSLSAFHYVIQPTQDAQQWYEHLGEDIVYVIAGTIVIEFVDGREYELTAGDSLHHDGDVGHRWRLVSAEPAEALIVTNVPAEDHRPGSKA